MRGIIKILEGAQLMVEMLIAITPTSEGRNKLTDLNMQLLSLINFYGKD